MSPVKSNKTNKNANMWIKHALGCLAARWRIPNENAEVGWRGTSDLRDHRFTQSYGTTPVGCRGGIRYVEGC